MFGYIKVQESQLRVCEFEQYKAVYCALCRTLGKRYGLAAKMTLSYDFTFLALFLMGMNDDDVTFSKGYCPIHPLQKRSFCCSNRTLDYTADVAVLLMYHKLCDNFKDEHFFEKLRALALRLLYRFDYQRACKRRPAEARAAKEYMLAQERAEAMQTTSLDACAEPTAVFLSILASRGIEDEQDHYTAKRFGYCLGRYIYFADAADDLLRDWKNGSFNPYIACDTPFSPNDQTALFEKQHYMAQTLHAGVAVCTECYEELPIKRFDPILRNILYKGMPNMIEKICYHSKKEEQHEKPI